MGAQYTPSLGLLGGVDHHANAKPALAIAMFGRQYRIVRSSVVNGALRDEPIDDNLYSSIRDTRVALAALRSGAA